MRETLLDSWVWLGAKYFSVNGVSLAAMCQ